jgi:prepilin-type N-terminal cleavage/methylation domain-containing protein
VKLIDIADSKNLPKGHPMQKKSINRPSGFTLIEIMVVVGIIALLFGLALMGLTAARRSAQRTRVLDDFQMITMALSQYRDQFHDYPRFADPLADQNDTSATNGQWLDYAPDRGARLLCQALIAPGPAVAPPNSSTLAGQDGADGPGFRTRQPLNGGTPTGKIYGPYLAPDKFKLEFNPAVPNMQDAKILDNMGNVILYYPATPGPPAVSQPNGYVALAAPTNPATYTVSAQTPLLKPLYNSYDNTVDTTTSKPMLDQKQMQYLLGDTNMNGTIESSLTPPEMAATTAPYLLWTAGADGQYGFGNDPATGQPLVINSTTPPARLKTDDITNFDLPQGVKK